MDVQVRPKVTDVLRTCQLGRILLYPSTSVNVAISLRAHCPCRARQNPEIPMDDHL